MPTSASTDSGSLPGGSEVGYSHVEARELPCNVAGFSGELPISPLRCRVVWAVPRTAFEPTLQNGGAGAKK